MYQILCGLFFISNLIAVIMLIFFYIFTFFAKIQRNKNEYDEHYEPAYPVLYNQHHLVKYCFWSGFSFAVLAWLFETSFVSAPELISDIVYILSFKTTELSESLLAAGAIWAFMFFVSIVSEIIVDSVKPRGNYVYSLRGGISSTLSYSIWCFVLSIFVG